MFILLLPLHNSCFHENSTFQYRQKKRHNYCSCLWWFISPLKLLTTKPLEHFNLCLWSYSSITGNICMKAALLFICVSWLLICLSPGQGQYLSQFWKAVVQKNLHTNFKLLLLERLAHVNTMIIRSISNTTTKKPSNLFYSSFTFLTHCVLIDLPSSFSHPSPSRLVAAPPWARFFLLKGSFSFTMTPKHFPYDCWGFLCFVYYLGVFTL